MIELPAERDVLARHPVESAVSVPRFEWIARILREVWRINRCRRRCRSVDGRDQHEIPAGIVDFSPAERQAVLIVVEPEAIVEHVAKEALFGPFAELPAQLTPPPCSHPRSREKAILSSNFS